MTPLPTPALLGTGAVGAAVAGFYYTTQRPGVLDALAKPIPFGAELARSRTRVIRSLRRALGAVLALHAILTVVYAIGAIEALASIDPEGPLDPSRVAVVVLAGLASLHTWVMVSDHRKLSGRLRDMPATAPATD